MITALVIGAGTQGLAIVNALKKDGYRVIVVCGEKHNYGDHSRYIDKKYFITGGIQSENYLEQLKTIISNEKIDAVIPMGDEAANYVCAHKEELQAITHVDCPDYQTFMSGYDKNKLMALCERNSYPHPKTLDLSAIDIESSNELCDFPYPAMLKPNMTTGGRGMVRVDSYEQLRNAYPQLHKQYGDYHLQQFVKPGGQQVKVQLYIDKSQKLIASSIIEKKRWYPVEGGSNCCAITLHDDNVVNMCFSILLDLNWLGFADFDLIEDPDTHQLLVMEINPRVPACIKSPIAAGLNWGEVIVNASTGQPQKQYSYRDGVVLRHLGFDVLWFIKSPKRWKAKPNWFKFFGKNVYYQDMSGWTDPLPFLAGTWNNIKKLVTGHAK